MLVGPIILLKVVSGTSLQFEILLRRPRCADARNVSFSPLYGGQFYIVNSADKTKYI